jgi:hypothetical protein
MGVMDRITLLYSGHTTRPTLCAPTLVSLVSGRRAATATTPCVECGRVMILPGHWYSVGFNTVKSVSELKSIDVDVVLESVYASMRITERRCVMVTVVCEGHSG